MKNNNEFGTSLLEFALVLPLLSLFLFGIIQYGWLFSAKLSLMNTTASAARYATVGEPRPTENEIRSMFMNNLMVPVDSTGIQSVSLTEDVDGIVDLREVKAVYRLNLFFPFIVPGNTNGQVELTAYAKMR